MPRAWRVGLLGVVMGVLALAGGAGTASAAAPANDTFDAATPITLPYTSGPIDTKEATVGPDDSAVGIACGIGPTNPNASNSVWYTFTAATDAEAYIYAPGSNYNVLGPAVTGSPSAGFTALSCSTGLPAEFPVHAGTTYYVDFIAFNGAGNNSGGGGTLRFSILTDQPPLADLDTDGVPNGRDLCPTVAAQTADGCPATPQAQMACASREVYLVDVLPEGTAEVRVTGSANTSVFAGRTVRILRDHRSVGTTFVAPNGWFTATVPAPSPRSRSRSRYQARIGTAHTENLKLERRMVGARLTRDGDTLTLGGRITEPLAGNPARIFLQRYLSCGRKQSVKIKGVRPGPDGHFAISFRAPPNSAQVVMYRATTEVTVRRGGHADTLTFTLPVPIDRP